MGRAKKAIKSEPVQKVTESEPTRKAYSFLREFREYALRGNLIDLAAAVIIGAAFGKVIDSLVKHIFMPLISVLIPGEQSYVHWTWEVGGREIPFGLFLGELVNFLVVALALFLFLVKFVGWLRRARQKEEEAEPPLTKDQQLLTEIRDLLKK